MAPTRKKKKLRKRDVDRLENTSGVAAIPPPDGSAVCNCSDGSQCTAASCAFSQCVIESHGGDQAA